MVGVLFGDFGIPLALAATDLGSPMEVLIVLLLDPLDAVHELRERFELCPLVVRRRDGHLDLDRFLDGLHYRPPSSIVGDEELP